MSILLVVATCFFLRYQDSIIGTAYKEKVEQHLKEKWKLATGEIKYHDIYLYVEAGGGMVVSIVSSEIEHNITNTRFNIAFCTYSNPIQSTEFGSCLEEQNGRYRRI